MHAQLILILHAFVKKVVPIYQSLDGTVGLKNYGTAIQIQIFKADIVVLCSLISQIILSLTMSIDAFL